MVLNETFIKYVFNKQNMFKHFIICILILCTLFLIGLIIIIQSYVMIYDYYKDTVLRTDVSYNYNISESSNVYKDVITKCLAIKCERIVLTNDAGDHFVYKIEYDNELQFSYLVLTDEVFDTLSISKYFTKELRLIIYGNIGIYIMDNNSYIETTLNTITYLIIIFSIIIIGINFYSSYNAFKNEIYEKKNYKTYIENKLQGNVSEMILHEIGTPLAILLSIYSTVEDAINKNYIFTQEEKTKLMDSYKFALTRINETIAFLAKSKYLKRDGNVSLYDSLEHVIASINSTHIVKVGIEYIDCEEVLKSYTIKENLTNSGFMNVLTVLFNNAVEACASIMTISIHELTHEFITIDIKDNGRGIRDVNDNLFKDSGKIIEQYGYSTKDEKGNPVVKEGFIYKILKLLRIKLICTDTNRGIGLYMNKVLLASVKGDIKLVSTSEQGTTFRIKVPITKKKQVNK